MQNDTWKVDLDRIASAIYPYKKDRFTYSTDFIIAEIEKLRTDREALDKERDRFKSIAERFYEYFAEGYFDCASGEVQENAFVYLEDVLMPALNFTGPLMRRGQTYVPAALASTPREGTGEPRS